MRTDLVLEDLPTACKSAMYVYIYIYNLYILYTDRVFILGRGFGVSMEGFIFQHHGSHLGFDLINGPKGWGKNTDAHKCMWNLC